MDQVGKSISSLLMATTGSTAGRDGVWLPDVFTSVSIPEMKSKDFEIVFSCKY